MMMYTIITAVVLIVLIGNFLKQMRLAKIQPAEVFKNIYKDTIDGLKDFKTMSPKKSNFFRMARVTFNSISAVLLLLMTITGTSSALFGLQLEGILLFIHVICAPLFAISITISIVLFAHKLQFDQKDYKYISSNKRAKSYKIEFWKKIYFWLFTIVIVFTIGSILLAMYPLLGTSGQGWLLNIHRYSALAILVFTVNYVTLKYTLKK